MVERIVLRRHLDRFSSQGILTGPGGKHLGNDSTASAACVHAARRVAPIEIHAINDMQPKRSHWKTIRL